MTNDDRVMCETCGSQRALPGTKRCDGCWEVERRLAAYLRTGGEKARVFVLSVLHDKLCSQSGCSDPATRPAAAHENFDGEVLWYCEEHAQEIASSKSPEYTVDCPACKCSFGVN